MEDCIDLISRSACLGSRQRSVVCATLIRCISCLLCGRLQVILLSCTFAASVQAAPLGIHLSLKNCSGPLWAVPKHTQVHRDLVVYCDHFSTQSWGDQKRARTDSVLFILQSFKIKINIEWPGSSVQCHWIYAKNETETGKRRFVCLLLKHFLKYLGKKV